MDVKLRRRDFVELIDGIGNVIQDGFTPLFVSEGSAEEKRLAISRSEYLRFAIGHLRQHRSSLVIYGTSLSPVDEHIAAAIRKGTREAAVALHVAGKSARAVAEMAERYHAVLRGLVLTFYDADTWSQATSLVSAL